MAKFGAYEMVDRKDFEGRKVLKTWFVDAENKSRFVVKDFNSGAMDEPSAKATTMSAGCLVDIPVTQRRHSRLTLGIRRGVLHVIEDEVVLVEPPSEWTEEELESGQDPMQLWLMKKILYGRRKTPCCWLQFFGELLTSIGLVQSKSAPHFLKTTDGQAPLEVHVDAVHGCGSTLALQRTSE